MRAVTCLKIFSLIYRGSVSWKMTYGFKSGLNHLVSFHARSGNITFNLLRENSPKDLCRFWNHMLFFTTQTLYILKWKFLDLLLLALKLTKFLMSFLEPKVSFSNFAFTFSVQCHETNSSVLFHLNLHMLLLMSFFKPQINFTLNFTSPFSVMIYNSP